MPRSILLGRPWPQPDRPLFLQEDTDYAIALAEEERDTCQQCGYPKSWCRASTNEFAFEPVEEECFVMKRLAQHQSSDKWTRKLDDTKRATLLYARFREGYAPDIEADLGLAAKPEEQQQDD